MASDEDREGFGDRVRRLRRRAHWSQEELAERAGLDRRYVGRIEAGEVEHPEQETVKRLANALNVKTSRLSELLGWVPIDELGAEPDVEVAIGRKRWPEDLKQAMLKIVELADAALPPDEVPRSHERKR